MKRKKEREMELTRLEIQKDKHPLLDFVQVAFIITNVHSKILYVNRHTERLFGYERGELEGQRIRMFFLEEDLIYFLPNIVYLTTYKNGFDGEALLRQKDGSKLFVHLSTASFKEEGEVFLTFSFHEIQRLKKMERERLEMEHWASLGMMIEEIAHQIRNPIVSIGGYSKRLLKTLPPSRKYRSYLEPIIREAQRLETIVHRVEEYVMIPKPAFHKEKIVEVVEAAMQSFSQEATEERISFILGTKTLEGDGLIFLNRDLVTRALVHVLQNSVDAILKKPMVKKQGSVNVTLVGDGERIKLSISDNGEGIPKKNLNHIFDPFFSTRPERVGLGLTFVKRVLEEHAGSIQIESRLRRGTTLTLILPKDRRRKVRQELISPEAKVFSSLS
ncbi:MAG: hypothetical protein A2W09_06305 [Deltaproteobacteria bacterium RBG_16_50_11]|nr:MAG: hypothetical protein A2W09_06305 [Deltaproteobacteria bacterium RBG_16_50_11]